MSHIELIKKLIEDGKFKSVSYTHTQVKNVWVTECKLFRDTDPSEGYFSASSMSSDYEKSKITSAKLVYLQVLPFVNAANIPGSGNVVRPKFDTKNNNYNNHKNKQRDNNRSCEGICRCVSIYGLHEDTKLEDVVNMCKRFGQVTASMKNFYAFRNAPEKRYIAVWMKDWRDADDIVERCNAKLFNGREMTVIKGHEIKSSTKAEFSYSETECEDEYDIPMPPRKMEVKVVDEKRKAELDREIDEYMRGTDNGDELDKKIDKYLKASTKLLKGKFVNENNPLPAMERTSHFTYEQELALVNQVCIETGCSIELLGRKISSHEPRFTSEQEIYVVEQLCKEFGLKYERIDDRNDGDDVLFRKVVTIGDENDDFRSTWNAVFSSRPSCSNLKYIINRFGGVFEGSITEKICNDMLIQHQRDYYRSLVK